MSRTCDICGGKIGLKAFHCQDGKICKRCYQIVSNNFTSTIIQKSLSELRAIYDQNAAPIDLGDDGFQITAKVDNVLLIDEKKWKRKLSEPHVISIEVIKDSLAYVCGQSRALGGEPVIRETSRKDGYLVTDHGNLILDVKFSLIEDYAELNAALEGITGVITTSLFSKEVNTVLIAAEKGVRTIRRKSLK